MYSFSGLEPVCCSCPVTDFSGGRSGGLVFQWWWCGILEEFSTVYCDPHSQRLGIVNKAEVDVFLELSCFFDDPENVGNLIDLLCWLIGFTQRSTKPSPLNIFKASRLKVVL